MNVMQRPILAATLAMFLVAASLGGFLGVAMAKRDNVEVQGGVNIIGGPREPISPDKFLECVDDEAWVALYVWDAETQSWLRYVNPDSLADADYVNSGDQAIDTMPFGSGVYLLMDADEPLQTITILDSDSDSC